MAKTVFFWAFEVCISWTISGYVSALRTNPHQIHLILQLIINRIYIVAEDRDFANKVKWVVAGIILLVNIIVFCIFIPAHLVPPPDPM